MIDRDKLAKQRVEGVMLDDNIAMKGKWDELRKLLEKEAGAVPEPIMQLLQSSFEGGWVSGSLNTTKIMTDRLEKILEKFDPNHEKK